MEPNFVTVDDLQISDEQNLFSQAAWVSYALHPLLSWMISSCNKLLDRFLTVQSRIIQTTTMLSKLDFKESCKILLKHNYRKTKYCTPSNAFLKQSKLWNCSLDLNDKIDTSHLKFAFGQTWPDPEWTDLVTSMCLTDIIILLKQKHLCRTNGNSWMLYTGTAKCIQFTYAHSRKSNALSAVGALRLAFE